MRRMLAMVAVLAAALFMSQTTARGAHNTVTLSAPVVTFVGLDTWQVTTTCRINNPTTNPQTGELAVLVFQIQGDGTAVQVRRQTFSPVDAPAGGNSAPVSILVKLHQIGSYVILADYASAVVRPDGTRSVVPHTHGGSYAFVIN